MARSTAGTALQLLALAALLGCQPSLQMGVRSRLMKLAGLRKSEPQLTLRQAFNEINMQLMESVLSDELEVNLEVLRKRLEQVSGAAKSANKKDVLREATELVLSLGEVRTAGKECTLRSTDILRRCDEAANGAIERAARRPADATRLDRLIHGAAEQRALACRGHYLEHFAKVLGRMPEDLLDSVQDFVERMLVDNLRVNPIADVPADVEQLRDHIGKDPLRFWDYVVDEMRLFGGPTDSAEAIRHIQRSGAKSGDLAAANLGRSEEPMTRDQIRAAYQSHLVRECEDFVNWLEADFLSANFDAQLLPETPPDEWSATERKYHLIAPYFWTCHRFVNVEKETFLKDIIAEVAIMERINAN